MGNHSRISELLVETGAYTDLDVPVILTSGQLGIYYINTEKLVQDGGEFEKFGDDSKEMVKHAIRMTQQHPTFQQVIVILADRARSLMDDSRVSCYAISGGQRRDWLFSGPVSAQLGLPHISIYKDGDLRVLDPKQEKDDFDVGFALFGSNARAIHIADLLTEASSCYRVEQAKEKGWIPELRKRGVLVNDLVTVVTRLQGGERNLAHQGVYADSMVAIDDDFLMRHSRRPDVAIAYTADPNAWSEDYLRREGALALLPFFDPNGGKTDRARKFWDRFGTCIQEEKRFYELDCAVQSKYGKSLGKILMPEELK